MNKNHINSEDNPSSLNALKVLVGAEVSTLRLGYDVTINFSGGADDPRRVSELRINPSFTLCLGKQKWNIDPDDYNTLHNLFPLLHTKVKHINYFEKGQVIELSFENGYYFKVTEIPKYEAWTLSGEGFFYVAVGV